MRHARNVTQQQLDALSTAWGIINMERQRVRAAGAHRAVAAIGRALKSLDGAIRHARRLLERNEGTT